MTEAQFDKACSRFDRACETLAEALSHKYGYTEGTALDVMGRYLRFAGEIQESEEKQAAEAQPLKLW
jgi:hypothetical protein